MSIITQAIDAAGEQLSRASKLLSTTSRELLSHIKTSNPAPLFPQFLNLPIELRRQIWREAFPPPRIIELVDGSARTGKLRAQQFVTPWISPATPPVLLFVCHESRKEVLRYYHLAFGRYGFKPRIYIDFARDIVYFGRGRHGDGTVDVDASMKDLEKIQNLAVTPNCLGRLLNVDEVIGRRFTGLREIYLVNLRKSSSRTYSSHVPPRFIEIESEALSQTMESYSPYSQRLMELQDRFQNRNPPILKIAVFMN
jgi:hypothetical protein